MLRRLSSMSFHRFDTWFVINSLKSISDSSKSSCGWPRRRLAFQRSWPRSWLTFCRLMTCLGSLTRNFRTIWGLHHRLPSWSDAWANYPLISRKADPLFEAQCQPYSQMIVLCTAIEQPRMCVLAHVSRTEVPAISGHWRRTYLILERKGQSICLLMTFSSVRTTKILHLVSRYWAQCLQWHRHHWSHPWLHTTESKQDEIYMSLWWQ